MEVLSRVYVCMNFKYARQGNLLLWYRRNRYDMSTRPNFRNTSKWRFHISSTFENVNGIHAIFQANEAGMNKIELI